MIGNKNIVLNGNELVYIPSILLSEKLYTSNIHDEQPASWNNNIWRYNKILVSAYHAKEVDNVKEKFNFNDDMFILGDSGGFQVVTLGGNITQKEVIEWQKRNCTAGLILDRPPYYYGGGANFSGTPTKQFFNECLNKTYNNAKYAIENKEDLFLYGVIQGETYSQMCEWYEKIHSLENDNLKFDGWALSPKPSNDPVKIALYGILVHEYNISTPIHILQVSSKGGIIVSALLRYQLQRVVTIDSSTSTVSARYGSIINPIHPGAILNIKDLLKNNGEKGWFCNCPICKALDISIDKIKSNEYMKYLNLHNLYQIVNLVNYIDFIVQYDDLVYSEAKRTSDRCFKAVDMLLYYKSNGLHKTKLKYSDEFENKNVYTKKSLFYFS